MAKKLTYIKEWPLCHYQEGMSFPLEFSGFISNSEALIYLMEMLRKLRFFFIIL